MAKLDCYTTRQILSWVNREKVVPNFFMNRYFSRTSGTTADKIALGEYTGGVYMAPFTGLCMPGVPVRRFNRTRKILEVKPPMIHLSDTVTPCDADEFRVGEQGEFVPSFSDRMQAAVAREATDQRNSIISRISWMCGMFIANGQYTVEGEGQPRVLLDFGRDASHTIDLTAGDPADLWTANTAEIHKQLEDYSNLFTGGGQIDVLMSSQAASAAFNHQDFQDWINKCCSNRPAPRGATEMAAPQRFSYARQHVESADFAFWTVKETFKDPANGDLDTLFIPEGSIALVNRSTFNGQRVFAGIPKPDGTYEQGTIIPRDYIDDACDCRKIGSKSRPLAVGDVNSVIIVKVMNPV